MSNESLATDLPTSRLTLVKRAWLKARRFLRDEADITVVVVCFMAFYILLQETGHGWGDDFALYINQTKALLYGDVDRVVADTRFAVENSSSSRFSPYAYPWGFPLMLVPLYLVFGLNYAVFKVLTIASLCGFLFCYHRILLKRSGSMLALLLTVVVATSPFYWGWAGSVTSDFPSLFFVGVTLLFMERCRAKGLLSSASTRSMVWLGLLIGWTFSIRRETVALVAALATMHLVELWRSWRVSRGEASKLVIPWNNLARPYWVAAAFVTALQLMLPSSVRVDRDPGGLSKLGWNFSWYKEVLAEALNLKKPGDQPIIFFGSTAMGTALLTAVLVLAACGVVGTIIRFRARDLHLVVFGGVTIYIVFTQPFHEGRYVFSTIPLLLYFASQSTVIWDSRGHSDRRRFPVGHVLAGSLLLLPLIGNGRQLIHAVDYHRRYDYVLGGPESVSAQELFDAVLRCTRGDDVVLFSQSRSMNLYTGRRSIQSGNTEIGLARADWLALINDDVDYWEPEIDEARADELGLVQVWHNDEYTLYRVDADDLSPFAPCQAE